MQARQWMVRWAMGVILLASSACAPSVKGLLHDPGFDYDTIVANQLAVGGVTSALYPLSETESRQFREYRGVFRYLPAGYVANRFGPDRYHRMLHDYGTSGEIGNPDLQVFHEELPDVRYVIFVRIKGYFDLSLPSLRRQETWGLTTIML